MTKRLSVGKAPSHDDIHPSLVEGVDLCFFLFLSVPGDPEEAPRHCQYARLVQHSDAAHREASFPGQVLHDRWDAAHLCGHVPCGAVPDLSQPGPVAEQRSHGVRVCVSVSVQREGGPEAAF